MPILRNPEAEETKEMARWEQFHSEWTIGGLSPGNPYKYRPFPAMMYRAERLPNGKWATSQSAPLRRPGSDENEWNRACQEAERFGPSCQRIVNDEAERRRALEEGWRETPQEALAFREAKDAALGQEAAERNWRDRNMSEKAKAESEQAESEHFGHLPEIPQKPITRRRKRTAA